MKRAVWLCEACGQDIYVPHPDVVGEARTTTAIRSHQAGCLPFAVGRRSFEEAIHVGRGLISALREEGNPIDQTADIVAAYFRTALRSYTGLAAYARSLA